MYSTMNMGYTPSGGLRLLFSRDSRCLCPFYDQLTLSPLALGYDTNHIKQGRTENQPRNPE